MTENDSTKDESTENDRMTEGAGMPPGGPTLPTEEEFRAQTGRDMRFFALLAQMATSALEAQERGDAPVVTLNLHQIRAAARHKGAEQGYLLLGDPVHAGAAALVEAQATQNQDPVYREFREACLKADALIVNSPELSAYISSLRFLVDFELACSAPAEAVS